jgi:hypothetical protein
MKRLQPLTAVALATALAAVLAAGCDRRSPSEPGSQDSLSLASIAPPSGARLTPGAPVNFIAVADYQLRSESFLAGDKGTITMAIEDQDGRDLDAEVSKTVAHGQGTASLSDRVDVPATGVTQIKVVLTLIPDAFGAPRLITAAAAYPVHR